MNFVAAGATTGIILARSGVLADAGPRTVALVGLPGQPLRPAPEARVPVQPETPQAKAGQDPEASEAVLARLYEEPVGLRGRLVVPRRAPRGAQLQLANFPMLRVPDTAVAQPPAWLRHAVPTAAVGERPMIAIVLDDLGLNRPGTRRAIALPAPLTLSFMTYAEGLPRLGEAARAAGHELLLHVPMEPRDAAYDAGSNVLTVDLPAEELKARIDWGLDRFEGFVGINNHMGSRFTGSAEGMAYVMRALRLRGLLFLDSLTAASSVGPAMARLARVPYARRDVFLDNEPDDPEEIRRQLEVLEAVARRRGYAVGIGHPHRATLDVLAEWLPEARRRGLALVPISAIVRHRTDSPAQLAVKATD